VSARRVIPRHIHGTSIVFRLSTGVICVPGCSRRPTDRPFPWAISSSNCRTKSRVPGVTEVTNPTLCCVCVRPCHSTHFVDCNPPRKPGPIEVIPNRHNVGRETRIGLPWNVCSGLSELINVPEMALPSKSTSIYTCGSLQTAGLGGDSADRDNVISLERSQAGTIRRIQFPRPVHAKIPERLTCSFARPRPSSVSSPGIEKKSFRIGHNRLPRLRETRLTRFPRPRGGSYPIRKRMVVSAWKANVYKACFSQERATRTNVFFSLEG